MRAMRLLWLVTLGAFVGVLIWAAASLPAEVPVHFGADGVPTRWGSKVELLAAMGVGGLSGVVMCGALGWLIASGRLGMSVVNVPHKDRWLATPDGEREVRARLGVDLLMIGTVVGASMIVLVIATAVQVRRHLPALPAWGNAAVLVMLAVLMVWTVVALTVRYRPPGD